MAAVIGGLISLATDGNIKIATTMTWSKVPHSTFLASGEYQVEGNIFLRKLNSRRWRKRMRTQMKRWHGMHDIIPKELQCAIIF